MRRFLLSAFTLLFLGGFAGQLAGQDFSTHTYRADLDLDLFLPTQMEGKDVPLVIFVHGGGFSGGQRSSGHTLARSLVARGIACASISYTLYVQGRPQDWGCNGQLTEKIKTLRWAVTDTWAATRWLADRADEFGLDTTQFFLAGSSAGAETVLHAAYWPRAVMGMVPHGLGADFTYAGISSGAGAIVDLNLITAENTLPLQLFHGTADPLVPYGAAPHHFCAPDASGWLMLFGAGVLAEHLDKIGGTYSLVSHPAAGHEIAGYYFDREPGRVADFVLRVLEGRHFQEHIVVPKK
ncbi:alpha/beta hydrolase [Neolewinella lacunae]|uniref:Alpha/beta hydrolase n=1 Tax=Neolewinella lacunae TaxID=1517758 RepID=A0A923TAG8_9BACT|nr:alpha/beta hydrolase [Neolewinella lacunae]MBC6996163.1 alpha/beta hydrolase [Neolewinella lacunae]MDN3634014.1 alpha/beta hydrolase [Neolewinella lacunae]